VPVEQQCAPGIYKYTKYRGLLGRNVKDEAITVTHEVQ